MEENSIKEGNGGWGASAAVMSSFYYLLPILLAIAQRSFASFPTAVVEDEPAVAVAPEPIAHVAPVVASVPAVAPAPYYPHMYPYSHHYYHPRAEVHNVEKAYAKESGHASETSVISGDGHLPLGLHPDHLTDGLALPGPFRSRVHRQKLAKKAHKSRAHKSFDKKKN